ncbi:MAG: universal stress protein [Nitriliruptorales bacterium]|nr:universal stress protein [Nitriliruptorales bacterium]
MDAPYRTVLVGTDGSPTATRAVLRASAVARVSEAKFLVAFVGDPREGEAVLDRIVATLAGTLPVPETRLLTGDPADALLGLAGAERVDLIVVGNKGMSGAQRFLLGSVPNKISHRAGCDVLVAYTRHATP